MEPAPLRQPLGRVLQARAGLAGSRAVRALLASGRVTVNGVVETSYSRRVTADFFIRWDLSAGPAASDQPAASEHEAGAYLLAYHKPCGVVTSLADERGRPDVRDAIPSGFWRPGLHPVGRLDRHSCGLLLWTTDGRLTRALLDPVRSVPREYEAVVAGSVRSPDALREQLSTGVRTHFDEATYSAELLGVRPFVEGSDVFAHAACDLETHDRRDDGPRPASSRAGDDVGDALAECGEQCDGDGARGALRRETDHPLSIVRLQLREGKKREVRRLLAHCGHPVIDLKRLAYGRIRLGPLLPGDVRRATAEEMEWAMTLLATGAPREAAAAKRSNCWSRIHLTIDLVPQARGITPCSAGCLVVARIEFL